MPVTTVNNLIEQEVTVREFLERRVSSLRAQYENAMLAAERFKAEMDEAARALAVLSPASGPQHYELEGEVGRYTVATTSASATVIRGGPTGTAADGVIITAEDATIKELILASLRTNKAYILYGASAHELIQYIKEHLGREIERTSISPTLSRMKEENLVIPHHGNRWKLPDKVKTSLMFYREGGKSFIKKVSDA